MKITVIGTGSHAGNCYLLEQGDSRLLLDAGVSLNHIKQGCGWSLSKINACLISHEHSDHCKAVNDLLKCGARVLMSAGTMHKLEEKTPFKVHNLPLLMEDRGNIRIGPWSITAFEALHDAEEPLGFLISIGPERVLYATDTAFIVPQFEGLTHVIIECNWMQEMVTEECIYRDRLNTTHMSLYQVLEFFKATDKTQLQEIILIHPSEDNMDLGIAVNKLVEIGIQREIIRGGK